MAGFALHVQESFHETRCNHESSQFLAATLPRSFFMIPCVLTIGASDSSGAAGVQADLKTFEARQVYGLSAIIGLTAQNSHGIKSLKLMEPDFIVEQIRVLAEFAPGAIKTGL